eukprot:scaffold80253_cov87-Phaeocystis_antarctica.AAC.1
MRTASSIASRSPPDAIRTIMGWPNRAGAAGLGRVLGQLPASCSARTDGTARNALLRAGHEGKRQENSPQCRRVCH